MNRVIIALVLVVAFMAVTVTAWAGVYPADSWPRKLSQAVFANGKLYWIGGRAARGDNQVDNDPLYPEPGLTIGKTYFENRLSGVSIYDPATNTWTAAKYDMTGPHGLDWKGKNNGIDSEDNCGGSGSYPGQSQTIAYDFDNDGTQEIFIHAGYPTWDSAFYRYDVDTDGWDRVYPIAANALQGYGSQYNGVADVDTRTGIAYCYGGGFWGPAPDTFAACNLKTGEWTVLPKGPVQATGSVGGVINGKLYIIGGTQIVGAEGGPASKGIWEYDIDTATWTGKVADLLVGTDRAAVAKYNNKIYVIGGYNNGNTTDQTDIQVFDPATKTVTKIGDLPVGMSMGGAAINPADGTLYVGGGRHAFAYTDSTKWYKANVNLTTLTWTAIPDDPASFPCVDWVTGDETITGTVKCGTMPVSGATVGMHLLPNAGADAMWTVQTDANGIYTFKAPYNKVGGGSHVYIAAWIEGFKSEDHEVTVPAGGTEIVNIDLGTLTGKNIAKNNVGTASRNTFAGLSDNPQDVFDGNMDTVWYPTGLRFDDLQNEDGTNRLNDDYVVVDLGADTSINGVTVYTTGATYKYRVDIMQGGDPLNQACWVSPSLFGATVTTIHEGRDSVLVDDPDPNVISLNFGPVNARGVRLYFPAYRNSSPGVREVKVHSATQPGGLVIGTVKDSGGSPIYNAAVQLGGIGSRSLVITDTSGSFALAADPGTLELYADALGYAANTENISIPAGTPLFHDVTLTSAEETGVYNGDFEVASSFNPFLADGWELVLNPSANPDMYVGSRDIEDGANTTPGGLASGWISTGTYNATEPYWYPGWIRPTATNEIAVDPSRVYNFYFKGRMKSGWALGFWALVWKDANGNETGRVNSDWFLPADNNWKTYDLGLVNGTLAPTIRVQPPAGTAKAEIQFGIDGWPGDTGVAVAFNFDDVIIDSMPAPYIEVAKISDLANYDDGAMVSLKGKQLTAKPGNGVPSGVAYVEETDRFAGLKLDITNATLTADIGNSVDIQGTLKTTAEGERYIVVTGTPAVTTGLDPIDPLAMTNRVAGTDLALSMYVKVWGTVQSTGTNYFVLSDGSVGSDGSQKTIKVYCPMNPSTVTGFVKVKGVVSREGTDTVVYMTDPALD